METANQLNDETGTIVFDAASGISLEEQQEILAGINAIASGRMLSSGNQLAPDIAVTKAKKKSFLFPLFVNIGALVLLISAFYLLDLFHNNDVQEIRESYSGWEDAAHKIIQDMRQETDRKISEKENQISELLKLHAVDSDLVLQEEQQLNKLKEEKARIEELEKLGTEQELANWAEGVLNGFYPTLNSQIESGRLDEARATIKSMKEFLNAQSLQGIRVFEERKQTHLAAIDAMDKVIASSGGVVVIQDTAQEETIAELVAQNTALERSLAAFTVVGADQSKIIAEYSAALSRLESSNASRQDTINKQDIEIQLLRTEIAQRDQRVSELNSSIAVLQAQYDDLQRRMEAAIRAFYGE